MYLAGNPVKSTVKVKSANNLIIPSSTVLSLASTHNAVKKLTPSHRLYRNFAEKPK